MKLNFSRQQALELLIKYNKEPFHIKHALTVEAIMNWYANELGYENEAEFWSMVGLLHDVDYGMYPEEHCNKTLDLIKELDSNINENDKLIVAIRSHAYGICTDVKPEHHMEKILFTIDELSGIIGAAALMRPSKSVVDMTLKSVKKKYRDKRFAAGCSRDIINSGIDNLDMERDDVLNMTLEAMKKNESKIDDELKKLGISI